MAAVELGADELGLFIDESGDTSLRDPQNKVFVFGCALVGGPDLQEVENRWRRLRAMTLGDGDAALHMREHSRLIRDEKQAFLLEVLAKSAFARIGISFVQDTDFDLRGEGSEEVLKSSLLEMLMMHSDVARYCQMRRMAIFFEKSPLHDRLKGFCDKLTLEGDGSPVPIRFAHLDKAELGCCGEIADCIAHTVAGIERAGPTPDHLQERYRALFQPAAQVPARHRRLEGKISAETVLPSRWPID